VARTFWFKQDSTPIFEDLLWSRPETINARGKLIIIGGNSFGFSAPGQAYEYAQKAGIGTTRVLLPEAIRKVAGNFFPELEFGASNPSGSFSQLALGEWLDQSLWADGILLAGDLGRNSETAILIEKFMSKSSAAVTITKDAVDYMVPIASLFADRADTTVVLSMAQLQKLCMSLGFNKPFKLGMDLIQLVDTLHEFSQKFNYEIVVKHLDTLVVGKNGMVSTTKLKQEQAVWRVEYATYAAVWRLQNPNKPFEAISTSMLKP
jgi:ADP-dependent NAD(P)H-hydrate dehydratase / NAD(P)H-hydrate epimerase